MSKPYTIGIVGVGPRGLAALESLFLVKSNSKSSLDLHVKLFEASPYPGAGQIWTPDQVETNLSNIHERNLSNDLAGRPSINVDDIFIPEFPGYADWLTDRKDAPANASKDHFPARSKLGIYLYERFLTIYDALKGQNKAELFSAEIVQIDANEQSGIIITKDAQQHMVDEIVLTIGHQPTYDSEQLQLWDTHAKQNNLKLYKVPYPVGALETDAITPETKIALRGFGLSMVDQVRALSIGFGGSFVPIADSVELNYIPSEEAPRELVAFSLNGLPPVPKPFSGEIDSLFEPSEEEFKLLIQAVEQAEANASTISDASFLIEAIAQITSSVYKRLGSKARATDLSADDLTELTLKVIKKPDSEHTLLVSTKKDTLEAMLLYLHMAYGKTKISLDYCLGQVWRFALGVLYHDYTYMNLGDDAMVDVVKYIEASKRYSYGPPVKSLQQLIALVKAGVLNLDFVADPEINLVPEGWQLRKDGKTIVVQVMVNSVIDAPQLAKVSSPLIAHLRTDKRVDAVSYKLGLHTLEDGRIISKGGNTHQNIALLGRLAKGSVVGVDDLIECFGKPARKWAEGVLNRN